MYVCSVGLLLCTYCTFHTNNKFINESDLSRPNFQTQKINLCFFGQRRRGLLRKFIFLVQVQAAITGFQTFYWSRRTASPQFIQWPVRINRLRQLGSVHKIHIHLEATSPLSFLNFFICMIGNILIEKRLQSEEKTFRKLSKYVLCSSLMFKERWTWLRLLYH